MHRHAALFLTICFGSAALTSAQLSPVIALLERYSAGHFDEAVAAGAAIEIRALRRGLTRDATRWVASGTDTDRRKAAVAAFVLEITELRLDLEFARLVDLVEATCAELRASPRRSRFELAWLRASIAVAGRARASGWLIGSQARTSQLPPPAKISAETDAGRMHVAHAMARFPDEAAFELARVVAWTWTRDEEPDRNGSVQRPGRLGKAPQGRMLDSAIARLRVLADDPVVGSEALVREGQLELTLGRYDEALRSFQRVTSRTAPPQVRFLSRYLAGRTLMAGQRSEEARRSFADALGIMPHADSAAIALASLQVRSGRPQDAASTVQSGLGAFDRHPDPGRLVGYGSYMYWPELRDAMRAEIQP